MESLTVSVVYVHEEKRFSQGQESPLCPRADVKIKFWEVTWTECWYLKPSDLKSKDYIIALCVYPIMDTLHTNHTQTGSDLKHYKTSNSYQHQYNSVEDRYSIRWSPMIRKEEVPATSIFVFSVWTPLKAWRVGKSECPYMPGQLTRICTLSCQLVKIGRKNARELRVLPHARKVELLQWRHAKPKKKRIFQRIPHRKKLPYIENKTRGKSLNHTHHTRTYVRVDSIITGHFTTILLMFLCSSIYFPFLGEKKPLLAWYLD